jgi:hypothetical protein
LDSSQEVFGFKKIGGSKSIKKHSSCLSDLCKKKIWLLDRRIVDVPDGDDSAFQRLGCRSTGNNLAAKLRLMISCGAIIIQG